MSIVQRSHFLTEADDSPVTSSALQTVINAFFKRIFTNANNAWIDISTKLSAQQRLKRNYLLLIYSTR